MCEHEASTFVIFRGFENENRIETLLLFTCFTLFGGLRDFRRGSLQPIVDCEQLDPATIFATPKPQLSSSYSTEDLSRGRYMVGLLGCGSCHTDGAPVGDPNSAWLLAGSSTGIAYTSPFLDVDPGVVFPANITPDMETGLCSWTMERLVEMIRVGTVDHSARSQPVMPWPAHASITREDALSIAAYLKSLAPVRHLGKERTRRSCILVFTRLFVESGFAALLLRA